MSEFPTEELMEEIKKTQLDNEKLKTRLPVLFRELERLLNEFKTIFQRDKKDFIKCTVMKHKIDLWSKAVLWFQGPKGIDLFKVEKKTKKSIVIKLRPNRAFLLSLAVWPCHGQIET